MEKLGACDACAPEELLEVFAVEAHLGDVRSRRERDLFGAKIESEGRFMIENNEKRSLAGNAGNHSALVSRRGGESMELPRTDLPHVNQQSAVTGARDIHDTSL